MKNIGSLATMLLLSVFLSCSNQPKKLPEGVMKKYVKFVDSRHRVSPETRSIAVNYRNYTLNLLHFDGGIGAPCTLSTTRIGEKIITFTEHGFIDGIPEMIKDGDNRINFSNLSVKEKINYLAQYHSIVHYVADSLPKSDTKP